MTMKQLAILAGVSVSTVSKAFSGSPEIPEKTKNRIFEIARRESCFDKYCKTFFGKKVIAVICPEFHSGYYAQQLALLRKEIVRCGGEMVASCYNFEESSKNDLITYYAACAKVDGMILLDASVSESACNVPMVVIGESKNTDSIFLSMEYAVQDAIEYLIKNGHTDIAFIGETLTKVKLRSFTEAMEKAGLRVRAEFVLESRSRFEKAGYDAMNALLALKMPPTAAIAAYDSIALGAMKSIYEHGLTIPEDMSLIGMDDNRETAYLTVPLTTITSYNEDLCEVAVSLLFDRIRKGDSTKPKKIHVSTMLVKRQSVGRAKR